MNVPMSGKTIGMPEPFVTLLTLKRILIRMNAAMNGETVGMLVSFVTHVTFERLLI